jgi:hypothetical protein
MTSNNSRAEAVHQAVEASAEARWLDWKCRVKRARSDTPYPGEARRTDPGRASQNSFIGIQHLTQAEVEEFRVKCADRAAAAAAGDQA